MKTYKHPIYGGGRRHRRVDVIRLAGALRIVNLVFIAVVLLLYFSPLTQALQVHFGTTYPKIMTRKDMLPYLPAGRLTDAELAAQLSDVSLENPGQYSQPAVGVYAKDSIVPSAEPYVRHVFIGWNQTRVLSEELLKTKRLHAVPLVTVEPTDHHSPRLITSEADKAAGEKLLEGIAGGQYDQDLDALFAVLRSYHAPIYLRFAHEMDLPNTYPWGDQNPASYVAAFRYAVAKAKNQDGATNVRWVWSPSGNSDARAYYPGDDVVDVVGCTVLYSATWVQGKPSFAELTKSRQALEIYHKPVWIAEFGVDNHDPSYQAALINDALQNYRAYGFSLVSYFDLGETNPTYKTNDYRVSDLGLFSPVFDTKAIELARARARNQESIQLVKQASH